MAQVEYPRPRDPDTAIKEEHLTFAVMKLHLLAVLFLTPLFAFSQYNSAQIDRFVQEAGILPGKEGRLEYAVSDMYTTSQTGVTHLYLLQEYLDIPVYNGILNFNILDGRILSSGNNWITDLPTRAPASTDPIEAEVALQRSAEHLGLETGAINILSRNENSNGLDIEVTFGPGNLSRENIPVRLMWLDHESLIHLCWLVEVHDQGAVWLVFIDAETGRFIMKYDLVVNCAFEPQYGHAHTSLPTSPTALAVAPDSSYNVYAMPVESPSHGSRSIVTRPWLQAGSDNPATSLQWHDNGTTHYTTTRGNNVYAYEDSDGNNTPGFSPDTADLRFDYPFDPLLDPAENVSAAVTNLFYWNNITHDVMYQYGFDEVAGNFQTDNLGRGGEDGDHVRAEAQDGGGLNNANFFTPTDGSSPRMQMFLWSQVQDSYPLDVNAPGDIAGNYESVESDFSNMNLLMDVGPVTGNLALVQDMDDTTHLACGEISNAAEISGKIALIDRGECDFVVKVKSVQDLGAIAAVVVNNIPEVPIAMGGTDNTITIPAVMMTMDDGALLKAALESGIVNVTLDTTSIFTPDGDFDNGIIVHEYGHGISTRLTGGPSTSNCLNNDEQMGEGWSDYFALMLTTDWTSAASTDLRGIGTYVFGEPTDGVGIRTYQYTTDMGVNPFTYADIADAPVINGNVSPHFVGSVWATMLWDMTWKIIETEGTDADIYHGTGGNNIALNLVINALKLQPCSPGFTDGRDAILLADEILYNGQHKCAIWEAFANRGLGVDADQGSTNDHEDGVESYDIPSSVTVRGLAQNPSAVEGQKVTLQVQAICECEDVTNIVVEDVLSDQLVYVPGSGGTYNGTTVQFDIPGLAALDTATFTYDALVRGCTFSEDETLAADNSEETPAFESIKLAGTGNKVWVVSTAQSVSPTHSWYADDYSTLADIALTLISPITVEGPLEITFWHRYETEANYDGGVVEYSTDGGTTWQDAGALFIENGYPATINTAGTNSTIAGRAAFTGDSDMQFDTTGFVRSRIEISDVNSDDFLLRFRFASDGSIGGPGIDGWYIDDIDVVQGSGVSSKSRAYVSGSPVDSMSYSLETLMFDADKIYVDLSATGDQGGSSWHNAIHFLPIALDLAGCRSADSVFVAEGRYVPSLDGDRQASFNFGDSTYLLGGFPTGGGTLASRDPDIYTTQLSGDIGISNDTSDNAYHVVFVDSTSFGSIADGIIITGGNANGSGTDTSGAAIFNMGTLSLNHVTINQNFGVGLGCQLFNYGMTAELKLNDCIMFVSGPDDIGVLNLDLARLSIDGTTQILSQ